MHHVHSEVDELDQGFAASSNGIGSTPDPSTAIKWNQHFIIFNRGMLEPSDDLAPFLGTKLHPQPVFNDVYRLSQNNSQPGLNARFSPVPVPQLFGNQFPQSNPQTGSQAGLSQMTSWQTLENHHPQNNPSTGRSGTTYNGYLQLDHIATEHPNSTSSLDNVTNREDGRAHGIGFDFIGFDFYPQPATSVNYGYSATRNMVIAHHPSLPTNVSQNQMRLDINIPSVPQGRLISDYYADIHAHPHNAAERQAPSRLPSLDSNASTPATFASSPESPLASSSDPTLFLDLDFTQTKTMSLEEYEDMTHGCGSERASPVIANTNKAGTPHILPQHQAEYNCTNF